MAEPLPLLQDYRWLVTSAVAIWGAGLATYQQVTTWQRTKSRVRVSLQLGQIPDSPMYVLGETQRRVAAIAVNAANHGQVDVRFEPDCCEIEIKKSKAGHLAVQPEYSAPHLPATITSGHNIRMDLRATELFPAIKRVSGGKAAKIRIHLKDAVGRVHMSGWISIP